MKSFSHVIYFIFNMNWMDQSYIIIIILIIWEFFTLALADGFLLEFEWRQVSSCHQAYLNNAVVWMISTHHLIFTYLIPFLNSWWLYWALQ